MRQVSRTGVKVVTSVPVEEGRLLTMRLSHGRDAIDVRGAVRWCRSMDAEIELGEEQRPSYEVGIAFTEVGDAAPNSLWRRLAIYREQQRGK